MAVVVGNSSEKLFIALSLAAKFLGFVLNMLVLKECYWD